ncbi:DUF4097 family beta strand repeat-containing protein [Streptomyces iconiensis]|uniref:DUF4097 family beta strand repeat-containing protein n=1 Tax=Streptomyces iconiensis TaxID=1384038 RepID=A0ABT7A7U5_9ACTN|nr:DUF4097 family beta strand repeat-containing protein [Streptomyces iconiensis]MDJ1137405.1 DUF4097 family beta strand repeat-containing protein [Streptomyces iconiensis]
MQKSRAAGALALTVAAVLTASLTSGCGVDEVSGGKAEHKSFAFKGKRLTVVSDDGRLDLVPVERRGGARDIEVTRWFRASKVSGKVRTSWKMEGGNTLRLKTTCSGIVVDCNTRHRVEVPRDVAVKAISHDGRVVAKGFSAPLAIRISDGNVNLSGVSGPLTLRAGNGNIRAERLRSPSVSADTRDGYLALAFARPPESVRTHVADGRTTVTVPKPGTGGYDVRTKSRDGRVKTSIPRDASAPRSIDASSRDGNITLRHG